jgi:membrane protease YdiL (CAAX protease family)
MVENNGSGDFDFETLESRSSFESNDVANVNVVWTAVLVEGLFVVLAIAFSFFNFFDHGQELTAMLKSLLVGWNGVFWLLAGLVLAVPLVAANWVIEKIQPAFYQPMQRLVREFFYPMFARSSWLELLIVSLAAGFGEELLFRWCLQGGVSSLLPSSLGSLATGSIALVFGSLLFGLCHFINKTYFVMAAVAGVYFGVVMIVFDSWIVAAVAHAAFDFYALLSIKALKIESP